MRDDGVRSALAFFTSAFSSYSGCRQYRENIAAAQTRSCAGAPEVHKLRAYFNHPGFIEPMIERVRDALSEFPIADATKCTSCLPRTAFRLRWRKTAATKLSFWRRAN